VVGESNDVAALALGQSSGGGPRGLRVTGLAIMVAGLLFVVAGVALGLYTYDSPLEQGIRRASAAAISGLNGTEVEGGGVASGAVYRPPGPGEYVMRQPATWLGGTMVFVGMMLLVFSRAGDSKSAQTDEAQPVQLDDAPDSISDDPFS